MAYKFEIIDSKAWLVSLENNKYIETELKKFFQDDILDSNFKLFSSKVRECNSLVGTFSTSQTQRFGKTKKGSTIFLVKPLDNKLPGFLISYAGKLKGKIAVKFKFIHWDNKLPNGTIIDIIGNYTEDNMEKILMYHYDIYPKKNKNKDKDKILNKDIVNRIKYSVDIFSIDPFGCEDIDDALSITNNNSYYIIGVHIAQPIAFLDIDSIIEKSKTQFSTLYLKDERKDLWGKDITLNSSLSEGNEKPAYTILLYYDMNFNFSKFEHFPSIIINSRKLTYENAFEYKSAINLLDFTKRINETSDFHDMVSFWMIKTNIIIGNLFQGQNIVPYRVNNILTTKIIEPVPDNIRDIFKRKNIETAYYSFEKNEHMSLGIKNYCHFTSPIRRLVDCWIHYYLTYGECTPLDLDVINNIDVKTKKFHRDINLEEKIVELFKSSMTINTVAYIYKILSKNIIEIYIPKLELFRKVRLYPVKFDYTINHLHSDNSIILEYEDQTVEYKVGNEINIYLHRKIDVLPKNKIVIEILRKLVFI